MTSESLDAGRSERTGIDSNDPDPFSRGTRPVIVDFTFPTRPVGDGPAAALPPQSEDAEPLAGVRLSPVLPVAVRSMPGMGRGVFATRAITAGEDFGRFPLLEVPETDPALEGVVNHYVFGRDEGPSYLVLGWPSLMNHVAGRPNVDREWVETAEGWMLRFFAVADIEAGAQLFIDYGCAEWWAQ